MNIPYLSRYRNAEYIQYLTDVLAFLEPHDLTALQLAAPQAALAAVLEDLNTAYKSTQGSEITPEIAALDERRDRAIVGLRGIVENLTYHFDPDTAAAASLLYRNITSHGSNIARLNYREQTAVLSSIVRDWEGKPEFAAAVSTLNLGNWLAELKESNQQFSAKYLARVDETAKNPAASIPELRDQGNETYRILVNHLTAHATLSSNPVYTELLDQIDVLAGQYNQGVDNRTTTTIPDPEPPTDPIS